MTDWFNVCVYLIDTSGRVVRKFCQFRIFGEFRRINFSVKEINFGYDICKKFLVEWFSGFTCELCIFEIVDFVVKNINLSSDDICRKF